jgi:hypothetical protein
VCLLLLQTSLANLGVREHTDDSAILLDALELTCSGLATVLGSLLGVASERLFLGAVPVLCANCGRVLGNFRVNNANINLVEPSLDFIAEVVRPDGRERTKTTGSLNVADNADDNERRSFDNGNGLCKSIPSV